MLSLKNLKTKGTLEDLFTPILRYLHLSCHGVFVDGLRIQVCFSDRGNLEVCGRMKEVKQELLPTDTSLVSFALSTVSPSSM